MKSIRREIETSHERRACYQLPSLFVLGCLTECLISGHRPKDTHFETSWRLMYKELLPRGIRVGKERVHRLMQRHGIKAKTKRKYVLTTGSKHHPARAGDHRIARLHFSRRWSRQGGRCQAAQPREESAALDGRSLPQLVQSLSQAARAIR